MRVLMYPHGGSGNHGCEAIVRATLRLTGAEGVLASSRPGEDALYGLDNVCEVIAEKRHLSKSSFTAIKAWYKSRLLGDKDAFDVAAFSPIFDAAKRCDVALSVGGDNYCYGSQQFLYLINRHLRKQSSKTVLWGCSVEPGSIKGELALDLAGYDRIIARESLTYEALQAKFPGKVELSPDPAFALERKETLLPVGFEEGNTVGINVSPMIIGHEATEGVALQNYVKLIHLIIDHTDMQVALIPHVVWPHNDDRKPLNALYERFKESGRVVMVDDRPAEELKDIIARCRFMVAARTHASIAAYSAQVPTLVLGYSVKSRGIATDIFGSSEKYVFPIGSMRDEDDLTEAFEWLMTQEKPIKEHYKAFMPDYMARLYRLKI